MPKKRIVAALENCMKHVLVFFLGCIFPAVYPTQAQVNTGTVIVFQLANDKFVIAADSRSTVRNKPPEDNHCKITAFESDHVVFAVSGAAYALPATANDPMPGWDAVEEAKKAVLKDHIAYYWETRMLSIWTKMMLYHPKDVLEVASKEHGFLTTGIFAVARNGKITIRVTNIKFIKGKPRIKHSDVGDCKSQPCATGMIEVTSKYEASGKDVVKISTSQTESLEILRVVKLVDLTIAEDPSGTVGGPIDVLELLNDGTLRWRQKKDNCPESSD
jgi:hypothetical protein